MSQHKYIHELLHNRLFKMIVEEVIVDSFHTETNGPKK